MQQKGHYIAVIRLSQCNKKATILYRQRCQDATITLLHSSNKTITMQKKSCYIVSSRVL